MIKTMRRGLLRSFIAGLGSAPFDIAFTKRTTGDFRLMHATAEIAPYLVGGQAAYSPRDYDLVVVADLDLAAAGKRPVRSFPIDAVIVITLTDGTVIVPE